MKPKHPDHGSGGLGTKLVRYLSPVDEASKMRLTEERWADVNAEFSKHQNVAEAFCLLGMFAGILVPAVLFKPFQVWDIGIMFGAMITAPLAYVLAICATKGFSKAYPRWSDFSTMKYAIPWTTQLWYLYVPVSVIGAVSIACRILLPIAV